MQFLTRVAKLLVSRPRDTAIKRLRDASIKIMSKDFDVVVIGSSFVDLLCYVSRIPKPGETIKGDGFKIDFGGKAANQCVMAAKLGARTAMVAMLGRDQFGEDTVKNFVKHRINTDHILFTDKASTGMTSIGKNI